jgi:alpha-ketoglutarate-dependent taurine dioxygenase
MSGADVAMRAIVEPIKKHVGGIVHVDKAHLTDPENVEIIRNALEDRGVLVFPQLNASDEEQLALTDAIGERVNFTSRNINNANLTTNDVYKITLDKAINKEPDYVLGTFFWHIDGLLLDIPLPKATVLSARQLSAEGGSTEFASLYAAYEMLSDEEKDQIADMKVIHTIEAAVRPVFGNTPEERRERYRGMAPAMEHPLVWIHKDGRKSLLIGTHADGLVGWPGPHGRAMLWRLNAWASQPEFVYRHEWTVGDLVIWDNEGLMHRVVPYTDEGRVMHRTSIGGQHRTGHPATDASMAKMLEPVY